MEQEVMQELLTWMQQGEAFVLAQAPDIAKEIVFYGRACTIVAAAFVALSLYLAVSAMRRFDEDDSPIGEILLLVVGITTFIIGAVGITEHAMAFIAPKLYILSHVAKIL